jgi:hypothetical protein
MTAEMQYFVILEATSSALEALMTEHFEQLKGKRISERWKR